MITRREHDAACERAWAELGKSGLALAPGDRAALVAADFGLSRLEAEGAQILTFFATDRISAKAIVLFPGQRLPEHRHPPVALGEGRAPDPGKEEILRVQAGSIVVGLEEAGGQGAEDSRIAESCGGQSGASRCRRPVRLGPGEQLRLEPGSWHWLEGGPEGGVVLSFSTCVRDVLDEFSDPRVARITRILDVE